MNGIILFAAIFLAAYPGHRLRAAFQVAAEKSSPAAPQNPGYTIPVHADEVDLTFTVANQNGRRIDDVQLAELSLLDDGKKPQRILSFQKRFNLPVRAGILIDTSRSMSDDLFRNQQMASALSTLLLRSNSDQAFVMGFDFESSIRQDWTNSSEALTASIRGASRDFSSRMGGTAIFDAVYAACRDQFGEDRPASEAESNFIMLLSDGLDNFSRVGMEEAVKQCQQAHTAIYAFSNAQKPSHDPGLKTLHDLATQSGGRLFYDRGDNSLLNNLEILEQDLRNNYLIVYKPAALKFDGSYHHIKLTCTRKYTEVTARTGYFAPERAGGQVRVPRRASQSR